MARPSKLTDEVEEKILSAIRAGASIAGAAGYAGIDSSTFHRWMERGDPKGDERADAPFRGFRRRVEQARDEAEVRDITLIAKAATMTGRRRPGASSGACPSATGARLRRRCCRTLLRVTRLAISGT